MTPCWIFDIDGTLADNEHRKHHLETTPKDWAAFFAACHLDPPHEAVVKLARIIQRHEHVVYMTGRSDSDRDATLTWLTGQGLFTYPNGPSLRRLYMRAAGDHRADTEVKLELLAMMRNDGWEPVMAFDDRNSVVAMWRAAGIPCAQVAEGDF